MHKIILALAALVTLFLVALVFIQRTHFFSPTLRSGSFCVTLPMIKNEDQRAHTVTTTVDHKVTLLTLTPDEQREIVNHVDMHSDKSLCLSLAEKNGETAFTMDGFDTYFITSPLNIR